MKQVRRITYALRTNHTQYQYVCHELAKVEQMYETLKKQKQRCQKGFDEIQAIKGYAKHYLPEMNVREQRYMAEYLKEGKQTFPCCGAIDVSFHWRGIDLFPMLMIPFDWMYVPFRLKWNIIGSSMYQKGGNVYVILQFDKNT